MLQQQKQTELLKEQLQSENQNTEHKPSSNLTYDKQYEDTGIWVRGNEETGFYATVGQFKISENYEYPNEVLMLLDNRDYKLIMNLMTTLIDFVLKINGIKPQPLEENK